MRSCLPASRPDVPTDTTAKATPKARFSRGTAQLVDELLEVLRVGLLHQTQHLRRHMVGRHRHMPAALVVGKLAQKLR